MRTLIVDDEPLARSRLKRLLADHPSIECVGEASCAAEALALTDQLQPDLVMLDIEMPGGDGLTLANTLNQRHLPPALILVTAHPEHALDAYRVGPSDYLLKPVDPKRLATALARLGMPTRAHIEKTEALNPWISYHIGKSLRRIRFDKVQYFVAEDKVVKMVFDGGEAIVDKSLSQLETEYADYLLRNHRSYLVNMMRLDAIVCHLDGPQLLFKQSDNRVPISRRHLKSVKAYLNDRLSI